MIDDAWGEAQLEARAAVDEERMLVAVLHRVKAPARLRGATASLGLNVVSRSAMHQRRLGCCRHRSGNVTFVCGQWLRNHKRAHEGFEYHLWP